MDKITEGLQELERKGWSDIIDARWREEVIKDLKGISDITDEDINEILRIVLW